MYRRNKLTSGSRISNNDFIAVCIHVVMIMIRTYDYDGYVQTNLLCYFIYIDLENVPDDLLYVEKLQEADVRKEHKGLEECKGGTCISSTKINGNNIICSY